MSEQLLADLERTNPTKPKTVWQENHGNLLLGFSALVLVVGAAILIYRQSRFVPVRFPESDLIAVPIGDSDDNEENAINGIKVIVAGAGNDSGVIRVAFYETAEAFNDVDQSFLLLTLPIVDGVAESVVPMVQVPEKFAIAAFHDENNDGILNRNRLGIPSERYGFSENARGLTGPPSYQDALTNRPAAGGSVELSIR